MVLPKTYDILIESCLVFLIIFSPLAYAGVLPWAQATFETVSAVMFLLFVLKSLSFREDRMIFTPAFAVFLAILLLASAQLFFTAVSGAGPSTAFVPHTSYPWATKTEILKIISYSLIFFVAVNTVKTSGQINRLIFVVITMGFSLGVLYLVRYLGVKTPRSFINPDHFSAYLNMIIFCAMGLLFSYSLNPKERLKVEQKVLVLFSIVIMGTALFFTMSRGGMFSFIAGLLFIVCLVMTRKSISRKKWIVTVASVCILLAIAWLGATPVIERIMSIKVEIASRYFGGRMPIWKGTAGIIKDNPLFGTGLGTFNYNFPKYQPAQIMGAHYTYAHSDFLELMSEIGIIGFGVFAACLIASVIYIGRQFRPRQDPYVVGLSIGLFGSLATIFFHSFTDFNLHIPANAILLVLIVSLLVANLNYYNGRGMKKKDHLLARPVTPSDKRKRIVSYAVLFSGACAALFFAVASLQPAMGDYYFRKAKKYDFNIPAAVRYTLNAVKFDPSNALYHYELGKLYLKEPAELSGDRIVMIAQLNKTTEAYRTAVMMNPTNSKYHRSLAYAYNRFAELNRLDVRCALRYKRLANTHFLLAHDYDPNNVYWHKAYPAWWQGGCRKREQNDVYKRLLIPCSDQAKNI